MQNHRAALDNALEDVQLTKTVYACMGESFDLRQYRRHKLAQEFGSWLSARRKAEHTAEQRT